MSEAISNRLDVMLDKHPASDEDIEKRIDNKNYEISWFYRRLEEAMLLDNQLVDDDADYLIQLSD